MGTKPLEVVVRIVFSLHTNRSTGVSRSQQTGQKGSHSNHKLNVISYVYQIKKHRALSGFHMGSAIYLNFSATKGHNCMLRYNVSSLTSLAQRKQHYSTTSEAYQHSQATCCRLT